MDRPPFLHACMQVYELYPMSEIEITKARLREGVEGNHQWYGGWVDVPHSGSILDFVFSDRAQTSWDNNNYQDYHTRVQGAHTAEQLTELMYQALKKEKEGTDQVGLSDNPPPPTPPTHKMHTDPAHTQRTQSCKCFMHGRLALGARRRLAHQDTYISACVCVCVRVCVCVCTQDAEDREARVAYQRVTSRGDALRKRRSTVNEFLYTVPYQPVPGQRVEVFYNPEHTPLRGRPNIYMRCGFNR